MTHGVIFDMFETLITHYSSPVYFGKQMAQDAGISEECFQTLWRPTEQERSIGKVTFEEVLEKILRKNNCYSEKLFADIFKRRVMAKEECFQHLHSEIIPMLLECKKRGLCIGVISNCFSEEAKVIRESKLFSYFDAVYLSCEQGVQKPDEEIFQRCIKELGLKAEECLYVGDGGSQELETAKRLGMKTVQAVWYLREGTAQLVGRKEEFLQVETPLDVLNYLE